MNDTTKQMTIQISDGSGMPACSHDLGAISGRAVLSDHVGTSAASYPSTVSSTGTTIERDGEGSVLGNAWAFPGSPAWRPPIT